MTLLNPTARNHKNTPPPSNVRLKEIELQASELLHSKTAISQVYFWT